MGREDWWDCDNSKITCGVETMGKGSNRRPMKISQKEFEKNWNRIFRQTTQEDIYQLIIPEEPRVNDEFQFYVGLEPSPNE